MRQFFLLILFVLMYVSHLNAQTDDQYRDKNWNPKAGKYYFSTQLTYAFRNDFAEDESRRSGEISIYLDEKTGTFLFTPESYGTSGEMVDFVIADQEGNYIFGYTDEHGKKQRETIKSIHIGSRNIQTKKEERDFKKYCTPTGNKKKFGTNNYGWPVFIGTEYELNDMLYDSSIVYIATSQYSFLPMFLFNELQSETKLPLNLDVSKKIPSKSLILSRSYIFEGLHEFTLISYSPTEYFIDLKEYRSIKK